MPHSRVFIRLEVKDKSNLVDFSYSASDLLEEKPSEEEPIKGFAGEEAKFVSPEEVDILKGKRQYSNIILETYNIDMSENVKTAAAGEESTKSLTETAQNVTQPTQNMTYAKVVSDMASEQKAGETLVSNISKLKKEKISSSDAEKGSMNHIVRYLSGNPAVEMTEGFLHLYKELPSFSDSLPSSHMICMICIPATFCLQDMLKFLGPVISDLEMIKIVKPGTPNEYMALLKFRTMSCSHEFYKTFNDTRFNSIEPDVCHLVFVAKIECIRSQEGAGRPLSNAVELPVCAVCLEKMDESVEGILTILCNHSFHTPCIAQCEDTTCPVCRYTQTPMPVAGNKCFQCSMHEDLWICLICGEVGCGRYANGHAHGHFQLTAHTYAMQLGSNRVWDYVGENYVHRLVLNKVDGKLIEVNNQHGQDALLHEEKIESLSLEYTYLLTSQLESQRDFFEKKMQFLAEQKFKELEETESRLRKALEECSKREQLYSSCAKDKQMLDKKCQLLTTRAAKLQLELDEEKEMNRCLRDNQHLWHNKVSALEEKLKLKEDEINELNEQLKDVIFSLECREKLNASEDVTKEELAEGRIFLQPSASASSRPRKSKKKK